jgi:serine/threonine protein kinase
LHGETPFCHCQTEADLKNSAVKPIPENRFKKGISPLLRQLINSLLEINEVKRPSVYELANDSYIKALLLGQTQQSSLLKKQSNEMPPINLNQSYNHSIMISSEVGNFHKNVPVFRNNSLQSPRRMNNSKPEQVNPVGKLELPKREERKISFQNKPEPRNIELGGKSSLLTVKFGPRVPTEQLRPNSTRTDCDQRGKITLTYAEHPHLGALRQREFSEKTIETKESEEERGYFLKGEYSFSQRNFNN